MAEDKKPWYLSSADAKALSLTVRGFFSLGVLSAVVVGVKFLGVDLQVDDLNSLFDSVAGVIVAVGGFGSALAGLYGAGRKVVNAFKKRGA